MQRSSPKHPRPLDGDDAAADVFVLCASKFWLRRHLAYDEIYAKRQALTVGFHALAGLKAPTICNIDLEHCRPDELLIRIRHHDQLVATPITPSLAKLLTEWIGVRPESVSKRLLAGPDGPIKRGTIDHAMKAMGATFGIPHFADVLVAFFKGNLLGEKARPGDAAAATAYLDRSMATGPASLTEIARLLDRTDPFRGRGRLFGDGKADGAHAYHKKSVLPETYDACLPTDLFPGAPRKPELERDHPLIAALAAVKFPRNRRRAAEVKVSLYLQHRDAIEELLDAEAAPVAQLAALFRMNARSFARLRRRHRGKRVGRDGLVARIVEFADPVCLAYDSVERLLGVEWPRKREDRARVREPLFAKYGEEIEYLVASGQMLMREADTLFGFAKNGFRLHLARARAAATAPATDFRRRYATRDLSADEKTRLEALAGLVWPVGDAREAFLRDVLRTHAAFVCSFVGARKLRVGDAAKLLGLSKGRFKLLRAEFDAGTLELAIAPQERTDRALWRELVLREIPGRPKGQGDLAFCIDLRKRFGMTLPFDFVRTVLRAVARRPAAAKPVVAARPSRTPADEARLAAIAATRWAKRDEDEQRRALLKDHFPFVFALIDARKLSMTEAGRLFRVREDLMTQLRSDFRDGCFEWALRAPVPAAERAEWLELVRTRWPIRPPGQTPNEFCRDLRKRCGFPLQFASVNQVLARMRLHDPHEPSNFSKPGRVKPPLTAADRDLLERLRKADWAKVVDADALRHGLLAGHFPAVAEMLAAWKIDTGTVGRLFRLGDAKVLSLYREWREGTFDLAIARPPTDEERAVWNAFVLGEIGARGGRVGNVSAFWRRLRREKRLPLSLDSVRRLAKSARAASARRKAA
ncbi:hypothetical protein XI07_13900 [Bradyrhizobium sp. CCBAU 11445]|uniref:hypothetical protein n=1 Tax=Bradyrhizobium sp. CCBAU 11445 TaxID=1630896 RepID=UPI0023065928|nr:hypothetical protein [Bradyrhizobium sp. CCBAU 11445]MDA9483098.1 hypothetical protein [Bradyrhizobium sp. CCBAU 11445]